MKIESFKDFQKLVQLCRKGGVQQIKVDNLEITLGDLPLKEEKVYLKQPDLTTQQAFPPNGVTANDKIQTPDELTAEQLLYWSTGESIQENA